MNIFDPALSHHSLSTDMASLYDTLFPSGKPKRDNAPDTDNCTILNIGRDLIIEGYHMPVRLDAKTVRKVVEDVIAGVGDRQGAKFVLVVHCVEHEHVIVVKLSSPNITGARLRIIAVMLGQGYVTALNPSTKVLRRFGPRADEAYAPTLSGFYGCDGKSWRLPPCPTCGKTR